MNDDLKPCPFCGDGERFFEGDKHMHELQVACDCGATGPPAYDDGDRDGDYEARVATMRALAVERWNTRPGPTPCDAQGCSRAATRYTEYLLEPERVVFDRFCPAHAPAGSRPIAEARS